MKKNFETVSINPKRVLVLGGAGFIGSHLCRELLNIGHHVTCVDNLHTGRVENISEILSDKKFSFVKEDVCDLSDYQADIIYNLACPASPVHYQADEIKTIRTNAIGTLNALELAKKNGAIFVQASTSEVYGDPEIHPQTENYWGNVNPIGYRACYDEGKRVGETACFSYKRQHGLDVRVARIFNTYGPRMLENDGRVVSNFIVQAINGQPMTIYGDGMQTRSFCYVSDTVRALVRMGQIDPIDHPINIGNPDEYTIKDLATIIQGMTGADSRIEYRELPQDDPKVRKPDISRAKAILDWEPKMDNVEGLKRTIEYFRQEKLSKDMDRGVVIHVGQRQSLDYS